MSTQTLALTDVIAFINGATDTDLDRIIDSVNLRRRAIGNERAAAITIGTTGVLSSLSPKYLNGLSGKVVNIKGQRADVELDEASTNTLRFTRQTRFYVPADAKSHIVRGVPLSCIETS